VETILKDDQKCIYQAAIYIRLSREDGDKEESNSVVNQKSMLCRYVNDQKDVALYDIYIDDGYTGTNFERPSFKRMIRDIRDNKINCVIVKDLSRFGRDYIETGNYLERYFMEYNIRFIAINDNIDSLYTQYDMLLPIKNIFNQQYALDISKKVQSAFKAKQREGQFIGAFPSYGYFRDPKEKHALIIDEYAAAVVRRIFGMYAQGVGKLSIARILNEEGVLCPSEYKNQNGMNYHNSNRLCRTNYWTYSTIHHILKNQMYLGDMVQGKTKRRMKGKAHYLPEEQWVIVRGMHPAIVDHLLWQRVQDRLNNGNGAITFNQDISIFAGLLKCGDCGRALAKNSNLGKPHYVCATYKNYGKAKCSSHRINQELLQEIILEDLKIILSKIQNVSDLVEEQKKINHSDNDLHHNERKKLEQEIQKTKFQKKMSYQDYQEKLITKEEFIDYKQDYDAKLTHLESKRHLIEQKFHDNVDQKTPLWINKLLESNVVDNLDRNTLLEMVNLIYVYEDKTIKIVYNFI
jgi:Site-specific recombinases, DNA invertase Pin homologs